MTLVAVLPNRFATGVDGPDADWRRQDGHNAAGKRVRAVAVVMDLGNALAEVHKTNAHIVSYVMRQNGAPLVRQPRVNKPGLEHVEGWGFTLTSEVLVCDVDNPDHQRWEPGSEGLQADASNLVARVAPTAGFYLTRGGYKVIQPLSFSIPIAMHESVLATWLTKLEQGGIPVDWACRDWTRLFLLPHVWRDGRPYRSPLVRLDGMRPIDPPKPAASSAPKPKTPRRAPRVVAATGPALDAPLVRAFEAAGWLGRSLGPGRVAVRCPWEDLHTTGQRFDSSTVIFGAGTSKPLGWFFCSHGHCVDRGQSDVIEALPRAARAVLERASVPAPRPVPPPVAESARRLEGAIEYAPDGLSIIQAGCGIGKTTSARHVALRRAQKAATASGNAPVRSKTALSVPTTALALEQVAAFAREGAVVKRLFGVLSLKREDGSPECRFAATAAHLAAGGQSIPWELCEGRGKARCGHADTCRAYGGIDGADDARIIVGPHELLGQLEGEAGETGTLVIDEPPTLLETSLLLVNDLAATEAQLGAFDPRYAAAMAPAVRVVRHWLTLGPLDEPGPLTRAIDQGVDPDLSEAAFQATGESDTLAAVRVALPENYRGIAPPIRTNAIASARWSESAAKAIGEASRVLRLLFVGLTRDDVVVRLEERPGIEGRALLITEPNDGLRSAVMRQGGPTVVTDANADLHVPILARVVGYEPTLHRFEAADGAPVARTLLRTSSANRKGWMPRRRLEPGGGLTAAVRWLVDWALEAPEMPRLAVITMRTVELALRAALGEDTSHAWIQARQRTGALPELAAELRPVLARLPAPPDLGHFGAIRGLDHWKGHDQLATLGDPWQNLGDVYHDAAYLGLADPEARLEGLCQAELEQAHGRLRTVHRTRPARALHIGCVVPGGWHDVDVREPRRGPAKAASGMPVDELRAAVERLGGMRSTARETGVGAATLHRYLSGERIAPDAFRDAIEAAMARRVASDPGFPYRESVIPGSPT